LPATSGVQSSQIVIACRVHDLARQFYVRLAIFCRYKFQNRFKQSRKTRLSLATSFWGICPLLAFIFQRW